MRVGLRRDLRPVETVGNLGGWTLHVGEDSRECPLRGVPLSRGVPRVVGRPVPEGGTAKMLLPSLALIPQNLHFANASEQQMITYVSFL